MPRGRPPKIPTPPTVEQTVESLIAIYLSKIVCGMPGCDHKMHLVDARAIIAIMKKGDSNF